MRVVSEVVTQFQLELPIKTLFDAPTIAAMANTIEQYQAKPASDEFVQRMLSEIEALTEEEARKQLSGEGSQSSREGRHA
jgi:hypothetical protein